MIRRFHLLFPILLILITGCATYSKKIDKATLAFRAGNYEFAGKEIERTLDSERNRLLRLMELGVIYHEWEKFEESNRYFEEAYNLAESFYGVRVREVLFRLGTTANMRPYRSEVFEKVYIHYYKMLNYLFLAKGAPQTGEERMRLLDAVRVEARRAQLLLDTHEEKVGSYGDAKERDQHFLAKLLRFFDLVNGDIHSKDYIFRNNAFLHYIMGVVFEEYGEPDNARISYEKAAKIYEEGYVKQYDLDPKMTDQARFDAARILKTQKDGRWKTLAKKIKDSTLKKKLESYNPANEGSLLVLQEIDMSAPKGELNLYMSLNMTTESIEIFPILLGSPEETKQQAIWFFAFYAPRGILDIIQIIRNEKTFSVDTKTIVARGLLTLIEDEKELIDALETGIRISVPMYYYADAPFKSSLVVDGHTTYPMMDADNITALHLSNALASAKRELTESMAIETFKLSTCVLARVPPIFCSLYASTTNSADTRSWLTLPHSVRMQRLFLPKGHHEIKILNHGQGARNEVRLTVELEAGKQEIVRVRNLK